MRICDIRAIIELLGTGSDLDMPKFILVDVGRWIGWIGTKTYKGWIYVKNSPNSNKIIVVTDFYPGEIYANRIGDANGWRYWQFSI